MNRTLEVFVDQSTWPKGTGVVPAFPASFQPGISNYDINIPAMLLNIGYLTTPVSSTGVSLSEFWAWVRYLSAITNDPDMRLTNSFFDLDPHQKTILSDDFGMGVPMLWLTKKLSLNNIVDGNYFVKKIAASMHVKQIKSGKRGPNKTPDFVAEDNFGNWHVIECKGTQSGPDYSDTQLGLKGKPNTGGIVQKRSIIFPAGHTGQRLACGLSIGIEGKSTSVLKIVDPEPEAPFEVKEKDLIFAEDAIVRGTISKILRLSGFEITAECIASPLGKTPDATRFRSRTSENKRIESVRERNQRSSFEIRDFLDGENNNLLFGGRERTIELPRTIMVDGRPVSRVIIIQKINIDVIKRFSSSYFNEGPFYDSFSDLKSMMHGSEITSDELSARVNFGDVYQSELILD
ncbi:hypothetical protein [Erwinia rhapontici]|uniref:hypothetical protein n=1 Tax=Erwinia rhapontici TaxID=55212 RepID=UPI003BA05683